MVIFRISDGQKLYLRRLVYTHLSLWHPAPELALRLELEQALAVAEKLRQASTAAQIGVEEEGNVPL